jgi:hypothetical protein
VACVPSFLSINAVAGVLLLLIFRFIPDSLTVVGVLFIDGVSALAGVPVISSIHTAVGVSAVARVLLLLHSFGSWCFQRCWCPLFFSVPTMACVPSFLSIHAVGGDMLFLGSCNS